MATTNIETLVTIIRRRWRAAAAAATITVLVVAGWVTATEEQYQAHTQILVTDPSSEAVYNTNRGWNPGDSEREISTQIELAGSPTVANAAKTAADIDITDATITVTRVPGTFVLKITATHPDPTVAAVAAQAHADAYVQERRRQFVSGIEAARTTLDAKIKDLDDQIKSLENRITTETNEETRQQLTRTLDTTRTQRNEFANRSAELEIDANLTHIGADIIGDAIEPTSPAIPNRKKAAVAAIGLAAAAAVAAAAAADKLNDKVNDLDRLEELTNPIPVLGGIPRHDSTEITLAADPYGPAAESYRMLRVSTQLLGTTTSDGPQTIIVTSATPGEGKTVTSVNLAAAYAHAGKKTLLIDGDLRRGRIREMLNGPANAPGLVRALIGEATLGAATRHVNMGNNITLHVLDLDGHPRNAADLLASDGFGNLLTQISQGYDTIIIDAPPVLATADPTILASRGGNVIVVADKNTPRRVVTRALNKLTTNNANVTGAVLNRAPTNDGEYSYSYHKHTDTKPKTSKRSRILARR